MNKQSRIKINVKQIKENPSVVSEALFQIITLIVSIFSFSFFIAAASAVASPTVKAEQTACCEKTKTGLWCQNSLQSNCDTAFSSAPTACDSTSFCRLGCCYDSREGTCAENTPRKVCELRNGTFDLNADCNIAQCSKGCCVLGDQASLVTMVRCKKLSSYYGLETDFRGNVKTEAECVGIAQAADKGACVITEPESTCKLTTRAECKKLARNNESAFKKGFLCSAEELGTPCARQHHTGCIEGKDEVYWFDSCGNPENIYDANKDKSYNNGKILSKEKSCGAGSANANSKDCGNCNYYEGSMCGKYRTDKGEPRPTYGDYICRDLNCYDTYNKNDYKHGESWCVYDGPVGEGRDLVGSRHWRHLCVMGEEKLEPCDDYRQSMCIEDKIDISGTNSSSGTSKFNEAVCKPNRWRECLDYNSKPNMEKLCNQNKDCYMTSIWGGKKLCLPTVPSGFNMNVETGAGVASSICSGASQKCTVVYVKEFKGWVCKQNCECEKQEWVNEMNKWCSSLGDCGGKYNIADKYTKDGYSIEGTENEPVKEKGMGIALSTGGIVAAMFFAGAGKGLMSIFGGSTAAAAPSIGTSAGGQSLLGFAKIGEFALAHQVAGPIIMASAAAIASLIINKLYGLQGSAANMVTLSGVVSAVGYSAIQTMYVASITSQISAVTATTATAQAATAASQAALTTLTAQGASQATIAAAQAAASAAATAAALPGATAASVTAAANSAAASAAAASQGGIFHMFTTAFGAWGAFWFAIIVMVIIALIMKLLKIGEKKEKVISFTCMPWQPPSGGADCEKCNGDPMKPCSEYRCKSLGAACSLLNPATDNQTCVWLNQYDTNAPTLKPWQDVLTYGHSYDSVQPCPPGPGCWKIKKKGATDGCIKAFTPLQFGITTNEPAQCKVDTNHTSKFDDMQFWLGGTSLYLYNHSTQMSLPSPAAINEQLVNPILKNDGKYILYVRCKDANGNSNLGEMAMSFCVDPGPDTTPARVERTSILNGAPVAAGTTSAPLDIFLNEPAECKWSRTDQAYENMNNTFACASNIDQMEWDMTYKCSTTLTKITDRQTNTYYFRCKDQPWLVANESDRNVNKESYVFKLEGSQPLNITAVAPNGTIYGGQEPVSVTLTVKTVNGYKNGDAKCSYGTDENANMIEFFTTGTDTHEQKLDLFVGDYKFYFACRDEAGNVDKNFTSFKVDLDKTPPIIVRVYQDGGMLKIITDEESDCVYGIKDCNYDFTSATEMPFSMSKDHTAEWRTDITYYIKCKDKFGNMPATSSCSMQVNAYDVTNGG